MTENKRFYIEDEKIIKDCLSFTDKGYVFSNKVDAKRVCEILNKFQERSIEDLKTIEYLQKSIKRIYDRQQVSNDEALKIIGGLVLENEELRKKLKE